MNWRIPHYLIVAGAVGLVALLLSIGQLILVQCIKAPTPDAESGVKFILAACSACGFSVVILFIMLFLFVWFIIGCIWVFSAWRQVQYTNEEDSNYCNPILYRFSYWLLLASIVYQVFSCCRSGFQCQHEAVKQRKKPISIGLSTRGI